MIKSLAMVKNYLSFWLTLVAISGSLYLGYHKDVDQTVLLPTLLAIYVTNRSLSQISSHWAASKDPNADTAKVIEMINEK